MDDPLKNLTVLIVDDEPSITRLFSRLLEREGYTNVKTVSNGLDALDYLDTNVTGTIRRTRNPLTRPLVDLVLIDIMLPDISGYELCRRFKKHTQGYLPILLLTGLTIEDNNARFIESGADDFLQKPTRPQEFSARVRTLLQKRLKYLTESSASDEQDEDSPNAMPQTGQMIGPWLIERTVSWSGASIIFQAHDEATGRHAALKILTAQAREYEDVRDRFHREADLMISLDHPNILKVYEKGGYRSNPWYAMEYIDGPNLEKYIQTHGVQPLYFNRRLLVDLADALAYVHQREVIHRDLKLNNIYLKKDHTLKLGDFGIALQAGEVRMTQSGYAIGTPLYMAPEQFAGKSVTHASDIYSFGVTAYQLITGRLPFVASNAIELMRNHLLDAPPPMRSHRPDVPEAWDDLICNRCMAKVPEQRPSAMAAVREALATLPLKV